MRKEARRMRLNLLRAAPWLARCAAVAFGVGLLLPAGAIAGADGADQAVTGYLMLKHAALVSFPLAVLVVPLIPLALQAMFGISRRAMGLAGAGAFLLAIPGLIAVTGGRFDGAHLAWLVAAALMIAAGILAGLPARAEALDFISPYRVSGLGRKS